MRVRTARWLALAFLGLGWATSASAQVVLSGGTTPPAAAAGSVVQLTGTGYPAGVIIGANLLVTVTPPPGNGTAVTVPAMVVVPPNAPNSTTVRTVIFTVPAALATNSQIVCSVTVASKTGATPAFTTASPASLTINPPAGLTQFLPGAGTLGTAVPVKLLGNGFTHFNTASAVTFQTEGGVTSSALTLSGVSYPSANEIDGTLNI
ncbi:MAG TPA: hypothetical protein VNE83_07975, partial [Terriglobales bacterium]|nr:hypothetical protein [Terriglobales bacterium]